MVKIQIDLDREEDANVEIYKLAHNLRTKEEAIKIMINFFKARIEPEKLPRKKYFRLKGK